MPSLARIKGRFNFCMLAGGCRGLLKGNIEKMKELTTFHKRVSVDLCFSATNEIYF